MSGPICRDLDHSGSVKISNNPQIGLLVFVSNVFVVFYFGMQQLYILTFKRVDVFGMFGFGELPFSRNLKFGCYLYYRYFVHQEKRMSPEFWTYKSAKITGNHPKSSNTIKKLWFWP